MSLSINKHPGKVPYAFSKTLNRNVGVDEVERGKHCNCICIGCGMSVISKKGDSNMHHFAHYEYAETPCDYSYWVSIRDIAVQILSEATYIQHDSNLINCYNIPLSNKLKYIEIYHQVTLKKKRGMDMFFSTNIGILGICFLTPEKGRESYTYPYNYSQNLALIIDLKPILDNSIHTIDSLRDIIVHNPKITRFASYLVNQKELKQTVETRISFSYERLYCSKSIMDAKVFDAFGINSIIINSFIQSDFSAINVAKTYYEGAYKHFKDKNITYDYEELNREKLHSFIQCQDEYYATAFIINKFYIYQVIDKELVVIGKCFKKDGEIEQIIKSHFVLINERDSNKKASQEKYPTLF